RFLRWLAGLFLITGAGWGFIVLVGFLAVRLRIGISFSEAAWIGGLLSLLLLYWLEKDLWLSRFMCLRLGPKSTPLKETLFFWFTGIPGLLLRSTEAPRPARAVPKPSDMD